MLHSAPRRTLSLETLEERITPTGLGLTLPAVSLSLTLPSQGHFALGLGVDVGLLSVHAGVGTGGSLLSLGIHAEAARSVKELVDKLGVKEVKNLVELFGG